MSESPVGVEGKVVILTGGAGLLGTEYTRSLSRAGAHVVVADLDRAAAEDLAGRSRGARCLAVGVDVTDSASVERLVAMTLSEFGRVDGLVNNAALDPKFDPAHAAGHALGFESAPLDEWNRALAVNVTGAFLCCQAVARPMLAQGSGTIVNISSIYGLVGPDQRLYEDAVAGGRTKPAFYSVTKSALLGLTRYLAAYWAGKGIRVNTLTLGGVYDEHDRAFVERYAARTPLGRMARRDEYGGALAFLLSDAASYMTGANLVVDGGWTAW